MIGILYSIAERPLKGDEEDLISDNDIIHTVEAVMSAMENEHDMIPIRVREETLKGIGKKNFDMIFNLCENFKGDPHGESWMAGFLEMMNIPYTGAGPFSLALCLDKNRTKQVLKANKIPTPRYQVFHTTSQKLDPDLAFPLIVKPLHEDASVGIDSGSVVRNKPELFRRVDHLLEEYLQPAIVEEYVDGREINVAIMGTYPDLVVLPISEIVFGDSKADFNIVGFDAKWEVGSNAFKTIRAICPVELERELEIRVVQMAKEAYRICGCRDYGRVDIRINEGQPYVLEVNPNPGIGADSGFYRSFNATGMGYQDMIRAIITRCCKRKGINDILPERKANTGYISERIKLRNVNYGDIDTILDWMNDPAISRKMDEPDSKMDRDTLVRKIFLEDEDVDLIVEDENGKRIGFCSIYDISEWNGTCEISYFIGMKSSRNKGYGKETVKGLVDVCRGEIRARRIIARVLHGNEVSKSILLNEGFREVGILTGSHVLKDRSYDEYLLEKIL